MPPRNVTKQGDFMKLLTIILTFVCGIAWSDPLNVILYVTPSDESLLTTNVDTVQAKSYKNTVVIGAVLNSNTSFQAVRSGPRGQQTSVFTSGTNSNNTLFMINGSPVTDHSTTNSLFDAGVDAVTYADSIDLYKGSQSTLWGPGAIGGAININTGGALEDSITVKGGSNNTAGVGVNYFTAQPSGIYSIKMYQEKSDGYSIVEGGDKDGYGYQTLNFDSTHHTDAGKIGTTVVYRDSDADLDGSTDDPDYTADSKFYFLQARYESDVINLIVDRNVHDREYVNGSEIDNYDSSTNHFKLSHTNALGSIDYTVGTEASNYTAKFQNRGSYNSSVDKSAQANGYFVNADYVFDDFIVNTGVRYDTNSLHDDVSTYRFGLGYKVNNNITAIAGTNTGFRAPTLYEMYGADNFGYTGNPNLKEERAVTNEIGLVSRFKDEYVEMDSKFVVFSTKMDNMITYANSTYTNSTGTSTMQGWELQNKQQYDDTALNFSVTSVHAQDSNNVQLSRRPQYSAVVGVEHDVTDKLTLWSDWNYYGKHRDINPSTWATVDREAQQYADVGFAYQMNNDTSVTGTVNNIADISYQRPMGYKQPGREFTVSVKYSF